MKYKGIELEGLDKKVKLSHSRVMETDEGTDWIAKLLSCDKASLTPTRFHEVSALSSVINMDYQICNGGIEQYVFNGYHEYRAPYSDDDVAQLDLNQQFIMLCRLVAFGGDVFPGMDKNEAVLRWARNFHHLDWESLLDGDEDGYVDEYQLGKLEECEQGGKVIGSYKGLKPGEKLDEIDVTGAETGDATVTVQAMEEGEPSGNPSGFEVTITASE